MAKSASARKAAVQTLEALQRAGVTHLPKARRKVSIHQAVPTEEPAASEVAVPAPVTSQSPMVAKAPAPTAKAPEKVASRATTPAEAQQLLEVIRPEVVACTRCTELAETRTQTVFGVGNPRARLVFMGEAPGADEDKQGEPFVGRAGQLLTKIIEACKLRREDVYILNTLKCRPPGNRNPAPDEVANCRHFFERQLSIIQPEFLVCLGAIAAQSLLETDVTIGRLRGTFHEYRGIQVVCTYHPAYLLRNPNAKRDVWEDMKMVMQRMGVEL
ncbi:MAG: uracil-DNA glycosylase [Planctomycetes bacterium]|nr:uracil-DNA glycosylase [Planctomycetota bacterium]